MVYIDDAPYEWQPDLSVADLLARLPDGECIAVVKLDGKLVSRPFFTTTRVPDGARIVPVPMIAGG
jgi:sulfur carrier protein ThiS